PMTQPRSQTLQHTSTSSPALRNLGSNPPIASSASFQNAMLHPGMCSAMVSEIKTGFGPPGALAMASALQPSFGGGRFGPPTPTALPSMSASARNRNQWISGYASSSMKATISPVAALMPTFRAALSP